MTGRRRSRGHRGSAAEQRREAAFAELHEKMYDLLPAIQCKGLCADSCTVIDASELERERLRDAGVDLPEPVSHTQHLALIEAGQGPRCPALSPLNTCSVYPIRPLICRLQGIAEGMWCEHGCVPDGLVRRDEMIRAMRDVDALSAEVTGVARLGGGCR